MLNGDFFYCFQYQTLDNSFGVLYKFILFYMCGVSFCVVFAIGIKRKKSEKISQLKV